MKNKIVLWPGTSRESFLEINVFVGQNTQVNGLLRLEGYLTSSAYTEHYPVTTPIRRVYHSGTPPDLEFGPM